MVILLIDDETNELPIYLEDGGHTCETLRWVRDENWFLSQLEQIQPRAVILDYAMNPSGARLHEWIRKWGPSTLPIVFYTNYAKAGTMHTEMLRVCGDERLIVAKREAAMDVLDILAVIS